MQTTFTEKLAYEDARPSPWFAEMDSNGAILNSYKNPIELK